jgi:chaperonin GroES
VTIRPLRDRILVRRADAETITKGGIVLPENTMKDRPQRGTVLAVGPGIPQHVALNPVPVFDPSAVNPGDEILFTKYAGEGIKIDGQEYFLIQESELIAVIEPDPEPQTE